MNAVPAHVRSLLGMPDMLAMFRHLIQATWWKGLAISNYNQGEDPAWSQAGHVWKLHIPEPWEDPVLHSFAWGDPA